jgi:chorismate dehydratase
MRLMFLHNGISPLLETRKIHTPAEVGKSATAALVIGDAALRHNWQNSFEHVWDLGDLWARHSNLPFVFAVWAVRREFAAANPVRVAKTSGLLQESKKIGLSNIDAVVNAAANRLKIPTSTTRTYFKNFGFDLEAPEKKGLEAFFNDLYDNGILPEQLPIRFFDIKSLSIS